jgi:hypothetical protein
MYKHVCKEADLCEGRCVQSYYIEDWVAVWDGNIAARTDNFRSIEAGGT